MSARAIFGIVLASLTVEIAPASRGGEPENRPVDRPVRSSEEDMENLTKPYVEMALKEYATARERFLKSLPEGQRFYVSTKLVDEEHRSFEVVYVVVDKIADSRIHGRISSDINTVTNFKYGDKLEVAEGNIRDWTIVHPDGSEEGNFVGKFLDVVKDGRVPLLVELVVGKDGTVSSAKFVSAINRYKQDVSYCVPDKAKREVEAVFLKRKYEASEEVKKVYSYQIYLYHDGRMATDEDRKESLKNEPSSEPSGGQR